MNLIKALYLNNRFFLALAGLTVVFIIGQFVPLFFTAGKLGLLLILGLFILDILLILPVKKGIQASRIAPDKLSNGDENTIKINLRSLYSFPVQCSIIDEIPVQFQIRDFLITTRLNPGEEKSFAYKLRPVKRGEYEFGRLNLYAASSIGFVSKRYKYDAGSKVPVYPSFIQMRKYEILAISNRLTEEGIKKIRKVGRHTEFDQIREYVKGDDYRTINWKATARKADLMVNQYQEEKSQQVYNIIDMGRVMKSPFEGMTLLDYAINASLVISSIAMNKHDKAGLITLTKDIHTFLPADRKPGQMLRILEYLYKQQTNFLESNYELLYTTLRRKITQRSLLILYTNFESLISLDRQKMFLQRLAKNHLLMVIFFENTEIRKLRDAQAGSLENVYIKTIAEKFMYEKKQIVKELNKYGIHAILTPPENLTVNTINKYLELKALGAI